MAVAGSTTGQSKVDWKMEYWTVNGSCTTAEHEIADLREQILMDLVREVIVMSRDRTNCPFGVLRIASVQTLNNIPQSLSSALVYRDGEVLWREIINQRGGLLINGTRHLVEIISIDVGAPTLEEITQNIINAIESVANGTYGEVHATFAPLSSVLTEAHAIEAEKYKILTCAAGGSSPSLFQCDNDLLTPCQGARNRRFEYLFGSSLSAAAEFPPAISLARVNGAKTIAFFREAGQNDIFFKGLRKGTLDAAADNKLQVVMDATVPFTFNLSDDSIDYMKRIIRQLEETKPDLIAGAVFEQGCHAFVKAMRALNYTAPAVLMSECITDVPAFKSVLGKDGRYIIGSALWDRRLTGRIFNEDGSSPLHFFPAKGAEASPQLFYDTFQQRFGYDPSYHAACQFACALAVQAGAEYSNSLNPEDIRAAMNRLNEATFYGQLQFNPFGQIVETGLGATLQFTVDNENVIVLPIAAAASDIVYPMPTWDERVEVVNWYNEPAELGIVIIAGIGVLLCFALMILFACWRDRPQVIASSLLFVELIIFGAAMIYSSLFFWTLETTTAMCNLKFWLAGVGFVLMFSALLTKTWRVWRIFHERSLKMIKLTNSYLLKIMAVALAIEIIVLTIWTAVFTPQAETVVVDINRPVLNYRTCSSTNSLPFAIILIVYKAFLIVAGVVLGFWSRKIRSEYNESKFILIAMYNITFSAIILLVLFAIQLSDRYIDFLIRSIAIIWGVTATLCILLIPKIYYVATGSKDPTKKRGVWSAGVTPAGSSSLPENVNALQEQLELLSKKEQLIREKIVELKASDRKNRNDSSRRSQNGSRNSYKATEERTGNSSKASREEV